MKLFIWADPYRVAYGTSMLLAVAKDETTARKLAKKAPAYCYVGLKNNDRAPKEMELGKPLRVVDLPCAEWHEWSE